MSVPTEWIQELSGDELATQQAVLLDWVTEHRNDPEAQDIIRTIRGIKPATRVK